MFEQQNMTKPVVHYKGIPEFVHGYVKDDGSDCSIAWLDCVVDHPALGFCHNVRTSWIEKEIDEQGRFETRNTIYEPYQNS